MADFSSKFKVDHLCLQKANNREQELHTSQHKGSLFINLAATFF